MKNKMFMLVLVMGVFTVPLMAQDGGGFDAAGILTMIFGVLMTVFGGAAAWLKRKSTKLANFGREATEAAMSANALIQHHNAAIADDKLTREELDGYKVKAEAVAKETGEVWTAFKALFKKEP